MAAARDHFAVFDLPRSFDLDDKTLEEQFRALSRRFHPDRVARAAPADRRAALEKTTQLNEAYRVLRDPVRRAEHLLELRGVRTGEVKLPPEFLERTIEDREKLLEAKFEGGPGEVEELAQGVRGERDQTMAQVRALLAADPVDAEKTASLLARMRYYARFLDEVEGRGAEI